MRYNGWTNRETWLVNIWFNPESKADVDRIRAQMEYDVEQITSYLQDFINLSTINWDELKEHLDDDEEEE